MIRSLYRAPEGRPHTGLSPEGFATTLQTPGGLLWVDLGGEPPEMCEPISVINNRMNEAVKTLTLITTLFMPLSFVVGFLGMNFPQAAARLDIWTGKTAFFLTLVILLLTPVGMYLWMRRRAWM